MAAGWGDDMGAAQWTGICIVAAVVLVVIIVVAVLVGAVVLVANFINDFSSELKYLNCEIARTSGDERKHWIRRRRRLWLSWIPFVRY